MTFFKKTVIIDHQWVYFNSFQAEPIPQRAQIRQDKIKAAKS